MRVKDLILNLRIKKDNKLFERWANSSGMASKANIIKRVAKFQNKNQNKKLVMKGKEIAKKLNGKCFTCIKAKHLVKDCSNRT